MDWIARFAILIDGEFAKKTLQKHKKHFPTHEDLLTECARIQSIPPFTALELYRIYYYTADPLAGKTTHPIDHTEVDFSSSQAYARNIRLIHRLENAPNVAVRRGTLAHQGWEIGSSALLVAGSQPKDKDVMIRLVMNMLAEHHERDADFVES